MSHPHPEYALRARAICNCIIRIASTARHEGRVEERDWTSRLGGKKKFCCGWLFKTPHLNFLQTVVGLTRTRRHAEVSQRKFASVVWQTGREANMLLVTMSARQCFGRLAAMYPWRLTVVLMLSCTALGNSVIGQ